MQLLLLNQVPVRIGTYRYHPVLDVVDSFKKSQHASIILVTLQQRLCIVCSENDSNKYSIHRIHRANQYSF